MCDWPFVLFVCLSCRVAFRDVELPLHDSGLEPVEFLKSMGISLTPLNEAAGYRKVRPAINSNHSIKKKNVSQSGCASFECPVASPRGHWRKCALNQKECSSINVIVGPLFKGIKAAPLFSSSTRACSA